MMEHTAPSIAIWTHRGARYARQRNSRKLAESSRRIPTLRLVRGRIEHVRARRSIRMGYPRIVDPRDTILPNQLRHSPKWEARALRSTGIHGNTCPRPIERNGYLLAVEPIPPILYDEFEVQ